MVCKKGVPRKKTTTSTSNLNIAQVLFLMSAIVTQKCFVCTSHFWHTEYSKNMSSKQLRFNTVDLSCFIKNILKCTWYLVC